MDYLWTSILPTLLLATIGLSAGLFATAAETADNTMVTHGETQQQTTTKPDADTQNPLEHADVTIIKSKERTIEEYRVNGRLIQVKITPKNGYPYYLIDTDGDGTFDVRSSEAWRNTTVNTWRIYQW